MSLEEKLQALVAEWRKDVQFCLKESDRYADMQESPRSERFLTRGRTKENCADDLEALLAERQEPPALQVPPIWKIEKCLTHVDFDPDCIRCREEILTAKTEAAYRAGFAAAAPSSGTGEKK